MHMHRQKTNNKHTEMLKILKKNIKCIDQICLKLLFNKNKNK